MRTTRKFSFSFSKLRYGPLGFNPRKFRQHLTNWIKLNKIVEVWNSANSVIFSVCCHSEILLPSQREVTTFPLYCQYTVKVPLDGHLCVQLHESTYDHLINVNGWSKARNDYGGLFQRGFRLIESQLKGVIKGRDQLHGSTKRGVRLIDSQFKVVGANFIEVSILWRSPLRGSWLFFVCF